MLRGNVVGVVFAILVAGLIGSDGLWAQQPGRQRKPRADRQRSSLDDFVKERLDADDSNGDGKISKEEASGRLKQFFERVDANNDDVIDKQELEVLAERLRRQRRPGDRKPRQRQQGKPVPSKVPEGVTLLTDVPYREGNDKWRLDLVLPRQSGSTPRPAIVFVHGGGWRSGDKSNGQWRSLLLSPARSLAY